MKRLASATRAKSVSTPTVKVTENTGAALVATPVSRPPAANYAADETWTLDKSVLRRAAEARAKERRVEPDQRGLPKTEEERFQTVAASLNHSSAEVRKAAVKMLYELNPDRATSLFNVALHQGSPRERRAIGAALSSSGLIEQALSHLMADNHQDCYGSFSLLFLLAKSGEVHPLVKVIEQHPSTQVRLAVIRLLSASGDPDVISVFRQLASKPALSNEVRNALLEAVRQVTGIASSAA